MSNGKGENAEKMDSFEDPSNTSQTIVGEEAIEDVVKFSKRRRHSEEDIGKEDKENLPESKRVKKSPKGKKQTQ